jgi:hypothetical protein
MLPPRAAGKQLTFASTGHFGLALPEPKGHELITRVLETMPFQIRHDERMTFSLQRNRNPDGSHNKKPRTSW